MVEDRHRGQPANVLKGTLYKLLVSNLASGTKGDKMIEYKILQVLPCTDMYALYDTTGKLEELTAQPITLLALVRVDDGAGPPCPYNQVLGLELTDGHYAICNETKNFEGLCTKRELKHFEKAGTKIIIES